MKHLTKADLYLLVKLVNQQDETLAAVIDTAQMAVRQDMEFKALSVEEFNWAASVMAVIEARRRFSVIRNRLIQQIQEAA